MGITLLSSRLASLLSRSLRPITVPHTFLFSPPAGGEATSGRKRQRSPAAVDGAAEEIVLLSDDEDGGAAEAQQRRNIMNFAWEARQSKQQEETSGGGGAGGSGGGDAGAGPSTYGGGLEAGNGEEDARKRIMAHATAVNAQRGITAAAAAGPAAPATNSFLAQLHAERLARRGPPPPPAAAPSRTATTAFGPDTDPPTLTILSWNVWFEHPKAVEVRMRAMAGIIADLRPGLPDVIALQEMTPLIYSLLSSAPWWRHYTAFPGPRDLLSCGRYFTVLLWRSDLLAAGSSRGSSQHPPGFAAIPFSEEITSMGRDLKAVSLVKGGRALRVATTHLESPTGWQTLNSAPRQLQMRQALEILHSAGNADCVFIGDMNWNAKDGAVPLPAGWVDAWPELHPPSDHGYTYDAKRNAMLKGNLRGRLDRALARLGAGWELEGMEMVGTEAVPGERFEGKPVLPSDHYGILVTLRGKAGSTTAKQ